MLAAARLGARLVAIDAAMETGVTAELFGRHKHGYIRMMQSDLKGPVAAEIELRLTSALSPTRLAVINDSGHHAGHMGDDGTGESHFTVEIESVVFAGVSRVDRQRMVNRALGDLPGQRVHALAIKAKAPGE